MVAVLKQAFLSQQLAADLHMGKDDLFPGVQVLGWYVGQGGTWEVLHSYWMCHCSS